MVEFVVAVLGVLCLSLLPSVLWSVYRKRRTPDE